MVNDNPNNILFKTLDLLDVLLQHEVNNFEELVEKYIF